MLTTSPEKPWGLVLSGGGARGAFQVGVWEVLHNDPRGFEDIPEIISGTSAGALNGGFIAAGLSPKQMLDFWLSLADNPPVIGNQQFFSSLLSGLQKMALKEPGRQFKNRFRDLGASFKLLQKHTLWNPGSWMAMLVEFWMTARFDTLSELLNHIQTAYLFDTTPVRERLKDALGGTYVRSTGVKLAINTVDIKTGEVVRIVNAPPVKTNPSTSRHYRVEPQISVDMLLASASIPLLFNPVKYREMELWDGGLLVNTPLAPAVALGASRILPVLVTLKGAASRNQESFGYAIERLADAFLENAYNIDRKLLLERNTIASLKPDTDLNIVELLRAIRPLPNQIFDAGSYLYFERDAMMAMYEAGRRAALRWLEQGLEVDSREKAD